MGTQITYARPDGKEAAGYLANAGGGQRPGLVVVQEWWGLSEQIKGMCDRFALAGFDALAPDLYNGVVVPITMSKQPIAKCRRSIFSMQRRKRYGALRLICDATARRSD